jgi:NADH-quinone oxidoreductase subunit N
MNLGAFAIVALLRNQTHSEDLSSFRGLIYRSPALVTLLAIFLLSLLGLPPLVGFIAKFQVFQALYKAGELYSKGANPTLGYTMYALLIIGGLNTVLSVFYYIKVLKVMILDQPLEEIERRPATPLRVPRGALIFAGLLGLMIFVFGIAFSPLLDAGEKGVVNFARYKDRPEGAVPPSPNDAKARAPGGGPGQKGPITPGNKK